jgi:hypothetical protein
LKVTLSNLGEEFLQNYKLVKKIDNNFINETIEGDVIFEGEKHGYLVEAAINGFEIETGNVSEQCKDLTFTKAVKLSHKDGSFDFKKCRTTKQIKFNSPLDCVAEGEVNIFDYTSSTTETIQGVIDTFSHQEVKLAFLEESETVGAGLPLYNFSINYLLSFLAPIPNKESEGYYIQYKRLFAIAGPIGGQFQLVLQVYYIRNRSTIKHTDKWVLIPSETDYYLPLTSASWNNPIYDTVIDIGNNNELFTWVTYFGGQYINYQDVPISNTINFNEVLQGVFECTGFDVVSNFFGIAPDATNPDNKYYQYAIETCQNLRIVESYDIIRESALEDSFGQSGLLPNKDLITDLCTIFNLLIYPDMENEIIRIEHVSYYTTKAINLDTAAKDYEFGEISMNKDQIDIEKWQFAQPTPSSGFYEVAINYRNIDLFKEENEKIYKTKRIITDVFGTLNNSDFEKEEFKPLFYLLATDGTSIIELNNSLSMTNLFDKLHDVNRPLKSGFIGTNRIEFGGFSVGMSGEIKMISSNIMWDRISPMMSVVCKHGTFLIDEVDIDQKQFLTLKIKK